MYVHLRQLLLNTFEICWGYAQVEQLWVALQCSALVGSSCFQAEGSDLLLCHHLHWRIGAR